VALEWEGGERWREPRGSRSIFHGQGRPCHGNRRQRVANDFRNCATARAALHLSLRAPSARVDLPLDKGRLLVGSEGKKNHRRGCLCDAGRQTRGETVLTERAFSEVIHFLSSPCIYNSCAKKTGAKPLIWGSVVIAIFWARRPIGEEDCHQEKYRDQQQLTYLVVHSNLPIRLRCSTFFRSPRFQCAAPAALPTSKYRIRNASGRPASATRASK
jgi:hypothetical protein